VITKVKDEDIYTNLKREVSVVLVSMYAHEIIMLNNSEDGLFYFYHCLN
jgi:hypothetical protein